MFNICLNFRLGQTCNHVAGLLFRIESANRLGLTSCTSSKSKWTVPIEKRELHHKPLVEIDIVKSRHGRKHSRPLVNTSKRNYRPVAEIPYIDELIQNLKAVTPNSCMFKGVPDEKPEQPVAVTMDTSHAENVSEDSFEPRLLFDVSKHFLPNIVSHFKSTEDNLHLNFMDFIPELTDEEQLSINFSTLGQFKNPEWVQLRSGRITASNFYAVYTRVNSVLKKPEENVDNLLGMLCGYSKPNANIKSLKYGREMEPEAKKIYYQQYVCNHQNVKLSECGIFLDKRCSYLAASPDALVTCSCCGDGVLEVKCLCIEECKKCSGFCHCTLPNCLYRTDEKLILKHNHKYFAQVQAQMAFCNRQWCDFFIHTCNGTFIERIVFDQMYTEQLITNVKHFFAKYMVPELLSQSLKEKMSVTSVGEDISGSIFFCPVCKSVIKEQENIKSFSKRSICCDKCNKWYHFKCIKMTKTLLDECKNKEWFCQNCK
ncbi:unnamed protein product [Mytilus coruscus]|uniref:PHD-type domain-containing protein n=1 Tax=Mytilus coruscus TaxID=42192 RepID=A0A6J8B6J5_MYTCO|nr:unnamed protein product [Mytilus coruscus]